MTARLLELTQSIKVENLPAGVSADFITIYFENVRNGGGPVSDIRLFPEENSAIITFCDHKGNAVLHLTKLLPGGGPERKLLQMWALGEAWLAVAKARVHCSVLRLETLLHVSFLCYQRFFLIPALCMGCFYWCFFSPVYRGFYQHEL